MAQHYRRKYGLDFPVGMPDPLIELLCCKKYKEHPYKHGSLNHPGEHWLRGVRGLFTPEQLQISRWTEEFAEAWGVEEEIIIWGCAASEKSHSAALALLTYWLCDPTTTLCMFASTTREMLKMRSWSSVVSLYGMLKEHPTYHFPGVESRTSMAIINAHDDNPSNVKAQSVKASVRGVAVNEGSSLRGAHTDWVAVVLDEVNLMRQETYDERANLSIGVRQMKTISLCNASSFTDLGGRISVPMDGWASVDHNTKSWRTKFGGLVLRRNGYDSPAVVEPDGALKYPHIISQAHIDKVLKQEGSDQTVNYWSMIIGYPPPNSTEATVLTETDLTAYEAQQPATLAAGAESITIAALDAAFTSPDIGGDNCVLQFCTCTRVSPGIPALVFEDPTYLKISATSKVPVSQQILEQVRQHLSERNVPLFRLAVDSSGTQNIGDVLDMALGGSCARYNYSSKATDNHTPGGRDKYSDIYADLVTEMYSLTASFVRSRNIRAFPIEAARQITMRRYTRRAKTAKLCLESKKEFRKRLAGASPDECDTVAMCCMIARDVLGFHPGKAPTSISQVAFAPTPLRHGRSGISNPLRSSYSTMGRVSGYSAST